MKGHFSGDGEFVGIVVGELLESILNSGVEHVLPLFEPPAIDINDIVDLR